MVDWLKSENWNPEAVRAIFEIGEQCYHALAGTGHRPPRLGLAYTKADRDRLARFVASELKKRELPQLIITGGAQGFDQALAGAAFLLKIPFVVAVPFEGQEAKWPAEAQESYQKMLALAQHVIVVCPGKYESSKFIARDHFMVQASDRIITLWDGGNEGGTAETVRYAKSLDRPILNLWDAWTV